MRLSKFFLLISSLALLLLPLSGFSSAAKEKGKAPPFAVEIYGTSAPTAGMGTTNPSAIIGKGCSPGGNVFDRTPSEEDLMEFGPSHAVFAIDIESGNSKWSQEKIDQVFEGVVEIYAADGSTLVASLPLVLEDHGPADFWAAALYFDADFPTGDYTYQFVLSPGNQIFVPEDNTFTVTD